MSLAARRKPSGVVAINYTGWLASIPFVKRFSVSPSLRVPKEIKEAVLRECVEDNSLHLPAPSASGHFFSTPQAMRGNSFVSTQDATRKQDASHYQISSYSEERTTMKRFAFACMAALALSVFAQQKASAWCNFNFSAGVNTSFSSGGCRLLWGLVETAPGPNSQFSSHPCQSWMGKGAQQPCVPMGQPMGGYPMDYGTPVCNPYPMMPYADQGPSVIAPAFNSGVKPIGWFGEGNGLQATPTSYGGEYSYYPAYTPSYQSNYMQVPSYWFNQ